MPLSTSTSANNGLSMSGRITRWAFLFKAAWFRQSGYFLLERTKPMNPDDRLKRLRFRAWHRGTKEADILIGGYFDRHSLRWDEAEIEWFEALLQEEDVEIMAWAIGTEAPPIRYEGPMMCELQALDYIKHPE